MVDVSAKSITRRTARARGEVVLPDAVTALFRDGDIQAPKGAVFQTAIIAGTMAAKKTPELIPFCHTVPLDACDISITLDKGIVRIETSVSASHRTGVEMEALTATSVAALTVYDMCKSISHSLTIGPIRLLEKTGGKREVDANKP